MKMISIKNLSPLKSRIEAKWAHRLYRSVTHAQWSLKFNSRLECNDNKLIKVLPFLHMCVERGVVLWVRHTRTKCMSAVRLWPLYIRIFTMQYVHFVGHCVNYKPYKFVGMTSVLLCLVMFDSILVSVYEFISLMMPHSLTYFRLLWDIWYKQLNHHINEI